MANRTTYKDHGLVFAREQAHTANGHHLGEPLDPAYYGQREFHRLIKLAKVKRIKFHGLRHTTATLALREGVPVNVVAARLGHTDGNITLATYAHALPGMHKDAAARVGAVLHRRRPGQ
jgi:integrase